MRVAIPNRHWVPLTADERMAQAYDDSPGRLLELAELTGNRGMRNLALCLVHEAKPIWRKGPSGPRWPHARTNDGHNDLSFDSSADFM